MTVGDVAEGERAFGHGEERITPVGWFIAASTGPCSMCNSRYATASMAFRNACDSCIRASSTPCSRQARRCAPSAVAVRAASSRRLLMTSRALMPREYSECFRAEVSATDLMPDLFG